MDLVERIVSGDDQVISNLPPELILTVALDYLEPADILRLCRVSHAFNTTLCRNAQFWRLLIRRDLTDRPVSESVDPRDMYRTSVMDLQDHELNRQLQDAAGRGYEKLVDRLINDGANYYGGALVAAAHAGHMKIVNRLLAQIAGARFHPSFKQILYNHALASAAEGGHPEIVNRLLQAGADDYTNGFIRAIEEGHEAIMNQMLQLGVNLNPALSAAAESGHRDMVKRLLELGANNYGVAMNDAIEGGHPDIAQLIREWRETH
jgi:ankyrin repeat protein